MSKTTITNDQKETALAVIKQIPKRIIEKRGNNLIVTFGIGLFEFDPSYLPATFTPPDRERGYGETFSKDPGTSMLLLEYAGMSELACLRSEGLCINVNYNSHTWIGPPTLIGEQDDIQLMGAIMQEFPENYVFGGDFINGFVESNCKYQKILELHSLDQGKLEKSIQNALKRRLDTFELVTE